MNLEEVQIIDYLAELKIYFQQLNYDWIKKYFNVEKEDIKLLENPDKLIIKKGGAILIAKLGDEIIGTCGLIKLSSETFELVKMAVAEKSRGRKVGYLLGEGIIKKAKEFGASKIQLETNSILTPAINLYKKLGFVEMPLENSEYKRCNVRMILELNKPKTTSF
jgi:GNAT superfamily N-acetyltransferase